MDLEFERNRERYEFLRWGQKALDNFRAVPPNVGIVHQVNLEFLAKGVFLRDDAGGPVAVPDSLVGTDSHTTMINGLGVVGWGVGGIEAEAVMLGQPLYMLMPEVVGFELTGRLGRRRDRHRPGADRHRRSCASRAWSASSSSFSAPACRTMSLADRATIANMAPEYGADDGILSRPTKKRFATCDGPVARPSEVELVERYTKEQDLFRTDERPFRATRSVCRWTWPRSSRPWPVRSGRRTASP